MYSMICGADDKHTLAAASVTLLLGVGVVVVIPIPDVIVPGDVMHVVQSLGSGNSG